MAALLLCGLLTACGGGGDSNRAPMADDAGFLLDEDVTINSTLTGSDPEGRALTFAVDTDPVLGILTLNPDGSFIYAPNANANGTDSFTFTVSDGQLTSPPATVTLTINAINDPPAGATTAISLAEDTPFNDTLSAIDPEGDAVSGYALSAGGGSVYGTTVINTNGSFTYTPGADFFGTDHFIYDVTDVNGATGNQWVTVTVIPVNDAPVAGTTALATDEDVVLTGTLDGSDVDDAIVLFFVPAGNEPANGTLNLLTNGNFTFTPDANWSGTDFFTYQVSDGRGGTNLSTVTVTVNPINDAPEDTTPVQSMQEDGVLNGTLSAADPEGDTPITFSAAIGGDPANGTVIINSDGTFTYTPTGNFAGTDSFSYQVTDNLMNGATWPVTVQVAPVNDAPAATSAVLVTGAGLLLTGILTGTDVDGDTLSFINVSPPSGGTLSLAGDGSFTYLPDYGFTGPDSFTFRVNDGTVDSPADATVSLTVDPNLTGDVFPTAHGGIGWTLGMPDQWVTGLTDAGWLVDTTTAYEGTGSLVSGAIDHGGTSDLAGVVDAPVAGEYHFQIMVDSEPFYDGLSITVDGIIHHPLISGATGWIGVAVPITAGSHAVEWVYKKDEYATTGLDAAWLDNARFLAGADLPVRPVWDALPAGWMPPPGADGGWSVASDQVFEGAFSVKSDPIADGQVAAIETSGTFMAGEAGFAVRVSSAAAAPPLGDIFRFYVDGVPVMGEASGELPWTVYTVPVAAGAHTFRWEYWKDGQTVAGDDAAWIDAVSLPPPM